MGFGGLLIKCVLTKFLDSSVGRNFGTWRICPTLGHPIQAQNLRFQIPWIPQGSLVDAEAVGLWCSDSGVDATHGCATELSIATQQQHS